MRPHSKSGLIAVKIRCWKGTLCLQKLKNNLIYSLYTLIYRRDILWICVRNTNCRSTYRDAEFEWNTEIGNKYVQRIQPVYLVYIFGQRYTIVKQVKKWYRYKYADNMGNTGWILRTRILTNIPGSNSPKWTGYAQCTSIRIPYCLFGKLGQGPSIVFLI